MKKIIRNLSIQLTGRTPYYNSIIFYNMFRRVCFKNYKPQYLFIFCPPYSGSTLLAEILSSCQYVSCNNYLGTREGQTLPGIRDIMFPERNNENAVFDWDFIKKEWLKYWDTTKPILLEKSPENIFRVPQIINNFNPMLSIVIVRDPYAQCESLMRRDGMNALDAAYYALKCLRFQHENIKILSSKLIIKYEELVLDPKAFSEKLSGYVSELKLVNLDKTEYETHNIYGKPMPIINFNAKKISKINNEALRIIHGVFKENIEVLRLWGYDVFC